VVGWVVTCFALFSHPFFDIVANLSHHRVALVPIVTNPWILDFRFVLDGNLLDTINTTIFLDQSLDDTRFGKAHAAYFDHHHLNEHSCGMITHDLYDHHSNGLFSLPYHTIPFDSIDNIVLLTYLTAFYDHPGGMLHGFK